MSKLKKYILLFLQDTEEALSLEKLRFYRMLKGGTWYKHQMSGELPGCYGSFWTRYKPINRYTYIEKMEVWD